MNVIFSAQQMLELSLKKNQAFEKSSDLTRYNKIIRQNCYRLIRLIANLIDITKIDSGNFHSNFCKCNIINIVEEITLSVGKFIESREIRLTFDTETEESYIICDPDLIERIMLNLLSNAVKFTTRGGSIDVLISEGPNTVNIHVKDSGIGIPEGIRDRIFERFMQADNSLTRSREGSGVGLSLVKSLVEIHMGTIELISKKDRGSEFIIKLPKNNIQLKASQKFQKIDSYSQKIENINIEFSDIYDTNN